MTGVQTCALPILHKNDYKVKLNYNNQGLAWSKAELTIKEFKDIMMNNAIKKFSDVCNYEYKREEKVLLMAIIIISSCTILVLALLIVFFILSKRKKSNLTEAMQEEI